MVAQSEAGATVIPEVQATSTAATPVATEKLVAMRASLGVSGGDGGGRLDNARPRGVGVLGVVVSEPDVDAATASAAGGCAASKPNGNCGGGNGDGNEERNGGGTGGVDVASATSRPACPQTLCELAPMPQS